MITLRSGKEVELQPPKPHDETDSEKETEKREKIKGKKKGSSERKEDHDSTVNEDPEKIVINGDVMKKHMPPPFPRALHGKKGIHNASEILEVLRQLKVNIPLLDMIKQVSNYAKFLKDLCTIKRGLNVNKKAFLTEQVSAIIQCKSPVKYKDLGCPTISVMIGGKIVEKSLLDLGASVNLLPYSVYKQLGLGELKTTSITLSLADRSVKIPRGMIEDVLVQVDNFYYPVGFFVLDIDPIVKETNYVPIILRRPFLATSNAIINCKNGLMQLTFGNMTLELNIFYMCKKPINPEEEEGPEEVCIIDTLVEEHYLLATLPPWRRIEEILPLFNEEKAQEMVKEETPKLSLKPLPTELEYAYLEENKKCPVIISSSLTTPQEECLLEVLRRCKKSIGWKISDLKGINPLVYTYHIYMEEEVKPVHQPQRRLNPHMQEVVQAEGKEVATRLTSGWRVCIDYRKLNVVTRNDHFPLPFIDQVFERVLGHPFYCFLDGSSEYFQIEIDVENQEKTTFTCPFEAYAYRRMPFGLCNAPATFQRCMLSISSDMAECIMEVFIDDITIYGSTFEECVVNLKTILNRYIEKDLVVNWEKCHFMVQQGIVLGHIISKKCIEVDKEKMELIVKLPSPTTVKRVRQFFGHVGFYRSDIAMGVVLGQREDGKPYVIYNASKTLNEAQRNYITTEKELLAVVFTLEKIHAYLVGSFIVVFTDHSALKYLLTKQDAKARLIRWILLLQEFTLQIKDKKGVENVVADHLPRLAIAHNSHGLPINDDFSEESLVLLEDTPWYAHIANYLVTGEVPNQIIRKCVLNKSNRGSSVVAMSACGVDLFDVWGIDFMGPFPMTFDNSYILVGVDYVSKWVEAILCKHNDHRVVLKFLKENIFSRFGVPKAIINDGGTHFCNKPFETLLAKYGVKHKVATPYHPQTLRQVELANREIKNILMKVVNMSKRDWFVKLHDSLWRMKRWHDQLISNKEFQKGQRVLLYDSRLHIFPVKLKSRWICPFIIHQVHSNAVVELLNSNSTDTFKVNGHRLKPFMEPFNQDKEEFSLLKPQQS
ncbi:Retrovirus-related Pol polyprotein from transposon 17.6 [Vitis vinifera]|uniref:RNA-directed DNA polymerase n=1 Tax=Vitis vinifera TaxID=29760 RepID=A0A438C619_VITVI|nr:Retrovirus-related Pol polyprotein from transposon 17.6 [Vitis vinifera]